MFGSVKRSSTTRNVVWSVIALLSGIVCTYVAAAVCVLLTGIEQPTEDHVASARLARFGYARHIKPGNWNDGDWSRGFTSFGTRREFIVVYAQPTKPRTIWTKHSIDVVSAGWPYRGLRASRYVRPPAQGATKQSVTLDGDMIVVSIGAVPKLMPLGPHSPAFFLNVVFYACVVGGLCFVARVMRKDSRAGRGKCPICGHVGDPAAQCAECGVFQRRGARTKKGSRRHRERVSGGASH